MNHNLTDFLHVKNYISEEIFKLFFSNDYIREIDTLFMDHL